MLEIPALVTSAWTLLQPLLPVIAAKGAEKLGEAAGADLWTAIKKKFDLQAAAKEALADLLKAPADSDVQAAFRVQLKKQLEADPAFAAELFHLLEAAGSAYQAHNAGSGAIAQGPGAQAAGEGGMIINGDLTGNLTIGNNNKINSK